VGIGCAAILIVCAAAACIAVVVWFIRVLLA